MAKKKIIKSDSGDYRATQRPVKGPAGDRGVMDTSNIRRTVKGVLSGAPTVNERRDEFSNKYVSRKTPTGPNTLNYIMEQKKGGTVKKTTTAKKKK